MRPKEWDIVEIIPTNADVHNHTKSAEESRKLPPASKISWQVAYPHDCSRQESMVCEDPMAFEFLLIICNPLQVLPFLIEAVPLRAGYSYRLITVANFDSEGPATQSDGMGQSSDSGYGMQVLKNNMRIRRSRRCPNASTDVRLVV